MTSAAQRLAQLARGARTRAALALEEWRDSTAEWGSRVARWRGHQRQAGASSAAGQTGPAQGRRGEPPPVGAGLWANAAMMRLHVRYEEAVARFDDKFNARWDRLGEQLESRRAELRRRWSGRGGAEGSRGGQATASTPGSATASASPSGPPLDTAAMLLVGVGAGGALQGFPWCLLLAVWGVGRGAARFVVQRVDADDVVGLFRWAPDRLRQRRVELFARLKNEIVTARALRAGDLRYADLSWVDRTGNRAAMDPRLDYTPEALFQDAMSSIAVHTRVREALGEGVRPEAEPDKVVYRIHEGIAEVYLGWQVVGTRGTAEVQVKSTASIVDFIYVFPLCTDRYGLRSAGFVIRPHGNWSMDCKDLPYDLKQPFGGEAKGRMFRHREGVFEWDYQVREFRHGYEDHPRKNRKSWW